MATQHSTHANWDGERPCFRMDLVAEAIEAGGKRFIDVIDPDTGGEFRFFDVEYAIACAMDGERDVPGLVRWAQEELGISPTPAEVNNVIAALGTLGYLAPGGSRMGTAPVAVAPAEAAPIARAPEAAPIARAPEPVRQPEPMVARAPEPVRQPEPMVARAPEPVRQPEPMVARAPEPVRQPEPMVTRAPEPVRQPEPMVARAPEPVRQPEPATMPPPMSRPAFDDDLAPPLPPLDLSPTSISHERTPSQPVALPTMDGELALGVVAAKPVAPPSSSIDEFELGASGTYTGTDTVEDAPAAADLELGDSGVGTRKRPPLPKQADLGLAPMGSVEDSTEDAELEFDAGGPVRDLSTDLAAQMPLGRESVKEAVRSSGMMAAFDDDALQQEVGFDTATVPGGMLKAPTRQLSAEPTPTPIAAPMAAAPVERLEAAAQAAQQAAPIVAPAQASPVSAMAPTQPALREARPSAPPVVATPTVAPTKAPATKAPSSKAPLYVLLTLLVLGAVAFAVWKFVLSEPAATQSQAPVPVQEPVKPTPPPPAPPPIVASLALGVPEMVQLKALTTGVVDVATPAGADVKTGDVLLRFKGAAAVEAKIAALRYDIDKRVPAEIAKLEQDRDKATAANKQSAADALEAKAVERRARLAEKVEELKAREAELATFTLPSTVDGKVIKAAAKGARLVADAEAVTLEGPAPLVVSFPPTPGYAAGDAVALGKAGVAEPLACVVKMIDSATGNVNVECKAAVGFAVGDQVELPRKQ